MTGPEVRSPGERVLVLAPTRRDAQMTGAILEEAEISCTLCETLEGVCQEWMSGAGAALLTEESLAPDRVAGLVDALSRQPAWSDLPILVLTRGGADSPIAAHAMERLGNVVLLERPVRVAALVSAVRTALRARLRQYQIRDYLEEQQRVEARLQRFNVALEQRVAERTAVVEEQAGQLRVLASALTQTEQRERRRLAQVLHDHLQQLLVAAKMNISVLQGRVPDPRHRAVLAQVERHIHDCIEASRSLTVELSPPILYEAGLGAALAWLGRWMQEKHGLAVEIVADAEAEPVSEEVRLLLFETVRELLFNVVKHAQVDAARVQSSILGDRMQIVVSDRGSGFDPGMTAGQRNPGQGFGLFSVAQRLELLGGGLQIESSPGGGTRMTVHAPHEHRTSPPETQQRTVSRDGVSVPAAYSPPEGREKIRVLLADDHRIVRQGLAALLQHDPSIEVVAEAEDGDTAVELTRRLLPSVVVMDINMPGISGIEATRRIKADFPDIRVIGLSMHDPHDMARAMTEAGAAIYLPKGGPSEDLVAAVRGETSETAFAAS